MDNQTESSEVVVEGGYGVLPGYQALVRESFTKSITSWSLFGLLAISAAVASASAFIIEFDTSLGAGDILAVTILMFVAIIVNLLATVVALKYYLADGAGSVKEYFSEVLGSAWSYLWLLALSSLVVVSGFILFIIPGLILSTYLMFALYVRAAESITGMNALVRSTELVRGYWFALTGRLLFLTLAALLAFLAAGFVFWLLADIAGVPEATAELVSFLAFEPIVGALGTMISVYALTKLYRSLVSIKAEVVPEPSSVRGWYIGLAILAPILLLGILALLTIGYINEFDFVDEEIPQQIMLELDASI